MKTYEVTGRALTIAAGSVVELTDEQVRRRAHKLRKVRGRRYEVLAATEFKHGERVNVAGELPKALANQVAPVPAKPRGRAAATSSGGRGGAARSAPVAESDDREEAQSTPAAEA